MAIQALRYKDCKLQYQDESTQWYDIQSLNDCADSLIVPTPLAVDIRCHVAVSLTGFLKEIITQAIAQAEGTASSFGASAGIVSAVSSIVVLLFGQVEWAAALFALGQGTTDFVSGIAGYGAPLARQVFSNDFYDYIRCQLYCILDFDAEISNVVLDEWTSKIINYVPDRNIQITHASELVQLLNLFTLRQKLSLASAIAFLGKTSSIEGIFDCASCSTCLPHDLLLVGGGEADGGNAGEVIDHGVINGIRKLTLKSGPLEGTNLYRGTFELPYYTHCCQIAIREIRNFNYPNVTGATNPFAVYHPCGTRRSDPRVVLSTGEGTLSDLTGKCLASLQLYSAVNVLDPQPFEIDIDIEPCCHDWREEGQQGWQESGQTSPVNVVFDNNGLYGIGTSGEGRVYLQHNRTTPFKIHFEGKDLVPEYGTIEGNFRVRESDTTPSSRLTPDADGYYTITKPYVILEWDVTGSPTAGNPGAGSPTFNPVFTKFCYKPVTTWCYLLDLATYTGWTLAVGEQTGDGFETRLGIGGGGYRSQVFGASKTFTEFTCNRIELTFTYTPGTLESTGDSALFFRINGSDVLVNVEVPTTPTSPTILSGERTISSIYYQLMAGVTQGGIDPGGSAVAPTIKFSGNGENPFGSDNC